MGIGWLLNMKKLLTKINLFELGISGVAYYFVIFFLAPLLIFLGFSFGFTLRDLSFSNLVLGLSLLGGGSFILGYFLPIGKKLAYKIPQILAGEWDEKRAKIVFFGTLLIGLVGKVIRIIGGGYSHTEITADFAASAFYSTLGFVDILFYVSLCIAFIKYFQLKKHGIKSWFWGIAGYSTLFGQFFLAFFSCGRMAMISPLVIFLLLRSFVFKVDYKFVLGLGIIIFLLFPSGNFCRNPEILRTYKIIDEGVVHPLMVPVFFGDSVLSRTSQIEVFSKIVEKDLAWSEKGFFRKFLIIMGPPKFIWKDKPSINSGSNELGHKLGLIAPNDKGTSVGSTHVGDLYMNFGMGGIAFGMFFIGMLWRSMHEYFTRMPFISGAMFYAISWILVLKGIENSIVPVYAGLIKTFFMLFFIHLILIKYEKKFYKFCIPK